MSFCHGGNSTKVFSNPHHYMNTCKPIVKHQLFWKWYNLKNQSVYVQWKAIQLYMCLQIIIPFDMFVLDISFLRIECLLLSVYWSINVRWRVTNCVSLRSVAVQYTSIHRIKASAHSCKRFTSRQFLKLSFSLSLYVNLEWMSCLISFERCQSSCEEHGTSEHYKILIHSRIRTPKQHGNQLTRPPS